MLTTLPSKVDRSVPRTTTPCFVHSYFVVLLSWCHCSSIGGDITLMVDCPNHVHALAALWHLCQRSYDNQVRRFWHCQCRTVTLPPPLSLSFLTCSCALTWTLHTAPSQGYTWALTGKGVREGRSFCCSLFTHHCYLLFSAGRPAVP